MDKLIDDIDIFNRAKEKMSKIDDKMLLWLLKGTNLLDVPVFSYHAALVDVLEDRLYPEYDGDKVRMEDFGWRTPEGLIIYSDVFCTEVHPEYKVPEPTCCKKCPHCFRHFKPQHYAGHPETCSKKSKVETIELPICFQ